MPKVFSLDKWREDMLSRDFTKKDMERFTWPYICDGVEQSRIDKMGLVVIPRWMVERKDENA